MTRNQCYLSITGALMLLLLGPWGCIDVGHPSEIGCLVDMKEPGCNPATGTGGSTSVKSSGGTNSGGSAGTRSANSGGASDAGDADAGE